MSVENIRKLQENTAALYTERITLQVSVIRRFGYVYPEKLKRPPLPSGCEISGCKMSAHGIPDVKCRRTEFRMDPSSSTPSGFPKRTCAAMLSDTREHHTPDDSISYPDMLSGSLTTVSKPCYSPRSAALQWCVRMPCPDIFCHGFLKNSPQSLIALVIKKLSKH
uniref:Uncharacterized protein n=1 Tax=Vitis vinifera TaxID=29760 RepID=A5C2V6_VITVI|nr:hypothetical protein VITISV_016725 [Vitis vinifera]